MSYNFKSLGEVELLSAMPETANVFVEVDGGIRRAPQVKPVDEIAQIVGSETLEEVPEGATVLAEVNGEIKRVPSDGLGGSIKTAIIKDSDYDNALAGIQTTDTEAPTYSCTNMTFEEAYQTMASGEPLAVYFMFTFGSIPMNTNGMVAFAGTAITGAPCIVVELNVFSAGELMTSLMLSWTADGLSTEMPSGGEVS